MVDTGVLEALAERREGSSPFPSTSLRQGFCWLAKITGLHEKMGALNQREKAAGGGILFSANALRYALGLQPIRSLNRR